MSVEEGQTGIEDFDEDFDYEDDELIPVEPVNMRKDGDETYEDSYSFESVDVGSIPESIDIDGVFLHHQEDGVWWLYSGPSGTKPPVLIKEDEVYAPKSAWHNESKVAAYRALSILDSKGLVSFWSKQ